MSNSTFTVVQIDSSSNLYKVEMEDWAKRLDLITRMFKERYYALLNQALIDSKMTRKNGLVFVDHMVNDEFVLVRSDTHFLYEDGPLSGHLLRVEDIEEEYGCVEFFLELFSLPANTRCRWNSNMRDQLDGFNTDLIIKRLPNKGNMGLRGNYDLLAKTFFSNEE